MSIVRLGAARESAYPPHMANDMVSLDTIDEDTVILIFGFLSIPDILTMRQVRHSDVT